MKLIPVIRLRKTTGARHENSAQYMTKPTRHFFIRYKINDTDTWKKVKVKSVQPKQTGKQKNWVNVHWNCVKEWNELSYAENAILLTADSEMSQDVVDAKESLISIDVFEVVSFENKRIVSSHWVISKKYKRW